MRKHARGFTIVEMLVISPIIMLTIGTFITAIISMTGEVLAARAKNMLAYNVQDAMTQIEHDVRNSTSFLATNSSTPLTSPQGYENDTTSFFNVDVVKGDMLILEQNATLDNPITASRSLVYLKDRPYSCGSPQIRNNTPLTTNVVYFIRNNTLWRRTILQNDYASPTTSCATPWQQPSCQPGYSASGFCKTNDVELVKGVTANDFSVDYFDTPASTIANATINSPGTPLATRTALLATTKTARITINATSTVAGRNISWSASIRVVQAR